MIVAEFIELFRSQNVSLPEDFVEQHFYDPLYSTWLSFRRTVVIEECGEALIEIPADIFPRYHPHLYQSVGAPYQGASPFFLRTGVLKRLCLAQELLSERCPGARLKIFDGYRPLAVQKFLVEFYFQQLIQERQLDQESLSVAEKDDLLSEVFQIVARPSDDLRNPPPHTTGAAVDLTIVDEFGEAFAMGSAIDAMPPECLPGFYSNPKSKEENDFKKNRLLLQSCMKEAGFHRLPQEWWHFSYGDQVWAILEAMACGRAISARYGRCDLVE